MNARVCVESEQEYTRATILVRTESGYTVPFHHRLRAFLKAALRSYGIRAVEVKPVPEEKKANED